MRLLALIVIFTYAATAASAQVPRRWELSLTYGPSNGGPTPQLQSAMIAGGLNSTTPESCDMILGGGCSDPIVHPLSMEGQAVGMLALDYSMRPWWSLRIQQAGADLGSTSGYHQPSGYLSVSTRVTSTSVMASFRAGGLYGGIGPALHRVKVTRDEAGGSSERHTRIGATIMAGVRLPAHSRFFVDLVGEQHLVGSVPVGPYTTADSSATMPQVSAGLNYRTIKLGFGARM